MPSTKVELRVLKLRMSLNNKKMCKLNDICELCKFNICDDITQFNYYDICQMTETKLDIEHYVDNKELKPLQDFAKGYLHCLDQVGSKPVCD